MIIRTSGAVCRRALHDDLVEVRDAADAQNDDVGVVGQGGGHVVDGAVVRTDHLQRSIGAEARPERLVDDRAFTHQRNAN